MPEQPTRYRKKPIPVEARQVPPSQDGQSGLDLAAWCGGSVSGTYAEPKIFVPTLEGDLVARVGDWIVKGTRGEFWPVKGDIFAETYEPADVEPVDRAALRDRIAAAMAKRDGHPWPTEFEDDEQDYRRRADAALAVLHADQAAVVQEAVDSLAAAIRDCPASSGQCLSCEAKAAAIRELRRVAEARCGGAS